MAVSQEQESARSRLIKGLFLVGLVIFVGSGYNWIVHVYGGAYNTFWGMIGDNLKSYGLSEISSQKDDSRGLSQDQVTQLQLGQQAVADGTANIVQNAGAADQVKISTETIATPTTNYIRYTELSINQPLANGQKPDFSKFEGIWASAPNIGDGKSTFVNAMFGPLGRMPIGYLQPKQRQELVNFMQTNKVYTFNDLTVKKEYHGTRPVYVYEVDVNTRAYVMMLKKFDQMTGLNQIGSVDENQFSASEKLQLKVSVDVLSRNIVKVEYPSSGQAETFTGFGAHMPVSLPTNTVSVNQLEAQLQKTLSGQ